MPIHAEENVADFLCRSTKYLGISFVFFLTVSVQMTLEGSSNHVLSYIVHYVQITNKPLSLVGQTKETMNETLIRLKIYHFDRLSFGV